MDEDKYQVTSKRNLKEISWMFYALPLGIVFLILGIINFSSGASILLFFIGLMVWLPGLLIHYQYFRDNKDISIRLSKDSSVIEIITPTLTRIFKKADIKEILIVDSGVNKFAWGEYGFARIEFKTGEVINLTNLIIDQLFIADNFTGLRILKTETLIPTLDKKTRL